MSNNYPRDLRGYGANPPNPRWPDGARLALQIVLNYEEGGENCVLHGDPAAEAFLTEIVGAEARQGVRHMSMESHTYYFYQSQWTETPMVHIFPHWNWQGMEGIEIPVVAYSNCESVELFLNGESLGEKEMGDRMDLVWNVPYAPGVLKATGSNGGKVVYEQEIYTSGKPAKIELLADRDMIQSNGQDVVHIEVNVLDNEGHFVPDASNEMEFSVEGEGVVIAVDNGDPMSLESFLSNTRKAFKGKCLLIVKSTKQSGNIAISASSDGLEGAELTIGSE